MSNRLSMRVAVEFMSNGAQVNITKYERYKMASLFVVSVMFDERKVIFDQE
jgi:hypothetical protein